MTDKLTIYGEHDDNTLAQMRALMQYGSVEKAALLADGHFGYSQPIGGVVGYSEQVSVSGVGFDIGCGVKAVETNIAYRDLLNLDANRVADQMADTLAFGVGRKANIKVDHELFDSSAWDVLKDVAGNHEHDRLKAMARSQLSTLGSGNHFCVVLVEMSKTCLDPGTENHSTYDLDSPVWISTHFGSRGLGHNIASGFLKLGANLPFTGKPPKGERYEKEEPTLFELSSDEGRAYLSLMELAGQYAYAGRNIVVQQVLNILQADEVDSVHNHHNYSFAEEHGGQSLQVVRKGATPLFPGQRGAVGGSMCDISVILEGAGPSSEASAGISNDLNSTVHGAGRVMSRTAAKGKRNRKTGELILGEDGTPKKPGLVSQEMFSQSVKDYGIHLRGGEIDESPFVYRKLESVLIHHPNALVKNVLRPLIVCMAGVGEVDSYKD